jgi:hypothetical protein
MIDHTLVAHGDDGIEWVTLALEADEWRVRERTQEPAGYVVAQALKLITPHNLGDGPVGDFSFTERTLAEITADGGLTSGGLAIDWQDLATTAPAARIEVFLSEGKPGDPSAWSTLSRDSRGIDCAGVKARLRAQMVLQVVQEWVDARRFAARAATPPWSELLVRAHWTAREVIPEAFGLERGPHHGLRRRPRPRSFNWRDELGLLWSYSADDVQRAFHARAKRHHPDHGASACCWASVSSR